MSLQFALRACDRNFLVQVEDADAALLVRAGFGAMMVNAASGSPVAHHYRVSRATSGVGFLLATDNGEQEKLERAEDLIFHLDKEMSIALQLERPDLLFLHAAVLALNERAVVLPAPSGTGKSMLAMALVEDGFDYLSDEMAPIDAREMTVHPFAHALCLKSVPPAPYRLPAAALLAGERYYLPAAGLHGEVRTTPLPVAAFVFPRPDSGGPGTYRSLTPAAGAAHLIANALNSLAHPRAGLEVAALLSQAAPCYELDSADLGAACQSVRKVLQAGASHADGIAVRRQT